MFCKKLVLIAATAALALGSVAAKEQGKVHVRVHGHSSKAVCSGPGQSPMSVEGVEGVFCVSGQACVADISTGACPGPQDGLPNGAHCGKVITGVYGCKPNADAPKTEAPKTEAPKTEAPKTEAPKTEAPKTESPKTEAPKTEAPKTEPAVCSGPGQSPMSVEGVQGVFCVTGQACVADIANGSCPGPQEGLPNGAHCGKVKTGVYGCKPNTDAPKTEAPKTEAPKTEAPKTETPKTEAPKIDNILCSGPGQSPMSVEGVQGIYCVTGQACVANISNGACPGPQEGLPNGAYCGKVKTGVYGCKPTADAPMTEAPKTEAPKTEAPKTEAPKTEAPKTEAPKTEAPKTEAPKTEAPKTEAPTHAPKTHAPKTLAPVVTSAPTTHAPKTYTPKTHAPASNPSDNHGVVIVDIDVDVNGEDSDDSEDSSDVVYVDDSADSDDSEDSEDSSDFSDDRRL